MIVEQNKECIYLKTTDFNVESFKTPLSLLLKFSFEKKNVKFLWEIYQYLVDHISPKLLCFPHYLESLIPTLIVIYGNARMIEVPPRWKNVRVCFTHVYIYTCNHEYVQIYIYVCVYACIYKYTHVGMLPYPVTLATSSILFLHLPPLLGGGGHPNA